MSINSTRARRIFGGKESAPETSSLTYSRPLNNPADMVVAETLPVATTRRCFPGPKGDSGGVWSYHINVVTAAGATSTLKFYHSNLPNPDPTDATHWVDSGITAIDLTSTSADAHATLTGKYPTWIKAEAVVANSTGTIWCYVRSAGVEE